MHQRPDAPPPLLHPHMAEIFRQKTMQLSVALEHEDEEQRESARQVLRGFIDRIVIPADGLLRVFGNLGEMLAAAANGREASALAAVANDGCGGGI